MRDFLRLIKDKMEARDALQKVYGLTPLTIEDKFQAWVKATHPRREKPLRRR